MLSKVCGWQEEARRKEPRPIRSKIKVQRNSAAGTHVLLLGLSEEGKASQNSCRGAAAAAAPVLLLTAPLPLGPPRGSAADVVQMMSAVVLRWGSKPLAQPPTTRQMPSGLTPHLCIGLVGVV